ncbi:hypothetical protein AA0X95_26790 [Bacillus sp. 1P10SD]|uniref:hypothetical protein n=1 Tax=Bacillus sp. 1P10SD TaxID=3132265 RepID=UPI0039A51A23
MIIVGAFEQSIELEKALAILENHWIQRDQILVVFMDEEPLAEQLHVRSRNIHSNAFEVGMACATGSAVLGASIGFALSWGPIIWGLITVITGFAIGYGIYFFSKKNKFRSIKHKKIPEVSLIIQCSENQANQIIDILWKNQALTVGKVASLNN